MFIMAVLFVVLSWLLCIRGENESEFASLSKTNYGS